MKLFTRLFFLFLIFTLGRSELRAQLFVDTMAYTAQELVMDFFDGNCVDVMQVEFIGATPEQITFFEGSLSGLGVNAGLILTTGNPQVAVGPNDQDGASMGYGVATPDPLISSLVAGANGFDLAMLHFTIVPHTDTIGFQYVFGSEEFCEYVGSQFNDVFGFWISGPGFSGQQNIALVPGSTTPVAINNVNHLTNTSFYISNNPSDDFLCGLAPSTAPTVNTVQFDGLTTVLTAGAHVVQDATYEIWIGISDISDGIFDSGVFLSIQSLCGDSLLAPVAAAFTTQVDDNTVSFGNGTKYATAWHWDFGDGATSDERSPTHTYASLDQQYTVKLITTNYCCSDTTYVLVGTSSVTDKGVFDCKVYPTTFNEQLTIEPARDNASGIARLSDLTGRTVFQGVFSGKTTLQLGAVSKGAYLLELETGDHRRMVYKVVK